MIILKGFHLPAESTGKGVAMKTGVEFIQRMQEDAEFRQKVSACPNASARLAFLQREGYDFTAFAQILDNLSSGQWPAGGSRGSGQNAGPGQGTAGFFGRLRQIFRAPPLSRPDR
jgi:hypothetical protein